MSNVTRKIERKKEKVVKPEPLDAREIGEIFKDFNGDIRTQLAYYEKVATETDEDAKDENGMLILNKIKGYVNILDGLLTESKELFDLYEDTFKDDPFIDIEDGERMESFQNFMSGINLLIERLTDVTATGLTTVVPITEMTEEDVKAIDDFRNKIDAEERQND